MPFFTFDPPPVQAEFTVDDVRAMDVGRRQLKTEWPKTLCAPQQTDKNWSIVARTRIMVKGIDSSSS